MTAAFAGEMILSSAFFALVLTGCLPFWVGCTLFFACSVAFATGLNLIHDHRKTAETGKSIDP